MLRTVLRKYVPKHVYELARAAYHRVLPTSYVPLVTLEQSFGDFEKLNHVPQRAIATPNVPGMTLKPDAEHLRGSEYVVPEAFTTILDEVLVSPVYNVVLTPDKRILVESSNAGKPIFFERNVLSFREVKLLAGYSTLLRSRFDNYYHLLIDTLPRLLALNEKPFCDLDEIKLVCPGGITETEQFFLNKLQLRNVRVVPVNADHLYQAEHLILTPTTARWQSGYVPQRFVPTLRERLWPEDRSSSRERRLFISREKAGRRIMTNRAQVMDMLRPLGFERVVMEDLSPEEQIETLYEADAVVATHGAGLTNTLFARPGLKIVEIFPTYYVTPHYFYLSKALGHEYTYQCGSGDDIQVHTFEADLKALQESLSRLDIA